MGRIADVTDKPRLFRAAKALQSRWPGVWGFISKKADGLIKKKYDDLLSETLEAMAKGTDKDGRPFDNWWSYAERTLDDKCRKRTAEISQAEAEQMKMDLGAPVPKSLAKGMLDFLEGHQ